MWLRGIFLALQEVVHLTQNYILSGLFDYILFCEFTGAEVNLDEKGMCVQQLCVDFKRASEGKWGIGTHANSH